MVGFSIKLKQGLKNSLPVNGAKSGEPFFCTDTGELAIGQGIGSGYSFIATQQMLSETSSVVTVETDLDLPPVGSANMLYYVKMDSTVGAPSLAKFNGTSYDRISGSGSGSSDLSQVTKLGVIGSVGTPYVVNINVPAAPDMKRKSVDVLKFVPGTSGVVQTVCAFDNADSTSFTIDGQDANLNPDVIFDGTMRLQTVFTEPMTDLGAFGTGKLFSVTVDTTKYKTIEKIEIV